MFEKISDSNKQFYFIFILILFTIYTSYCNVSSTLFLSKDNLPFIEMDSFWFLNQAKAIAYNTFSYNYNPFYGYDLYGYLLAAIHLLTGINLELISFYSPIVFSILTVFVITVLFKDKLLAFLISIILCSSSFYLIRTSIGFSDTDSGIVLFIFLFIYALDNLKKEWIFIISCLFHWWYINASIIFLPIILIYFAFNYKSDKVNAIDKLFFTLTALLPTQFIFKIVLLVFYNYGRKMYIKVSLTIFSFIFLTNEVFFKILEKLNYYMYHIISLNSNIPILSEDSSRVGETKVISFIEMLNTVGLSNLYLNIFAFIGFFIGMYYSRQKIVLFLPILILGLIGLISGIRFFLYLDIALSIGLSFLIYKIYSFNKLIGLSFIFVLFFYIYQNIHLKSEFNPINQIQDSHIFIKETSNHINKNSNIVLLQWDMGHIFSYYTESLVSRNGAHHTALMNYFSLNNFINLSEEEFISNFQDYFKEYRLNINNKESFIKIDSFIKENANGEIKNNYSTSDKDMYIIIPMKIKEDLFRDLGTEVKLKRVLLDFKVNGNGTFVYFKNNVPENILIKQSELHSYILDNKVNSVNDNGIYDIYFNDKFIVTYDKSIENSVLINLLTNKSKYFELVNINKEFCLFKLKRGI